MNPSEIAPTGSPRMMDLVEAAGVNVSDWENFKGGKRNAASNPKFCYEWSFVQPKKVVVLNLWFDDLKQRRGVIFHQMNSKVRAQRFLDEGWPWNVGKRAVKMDEAVQKAYRDKLPVRVVVCSGRRREQ